MPNMIYTPWSDIEALQEVTFFFLTWMSRLSGTDLRGESDTFLLLGGHYIGYVKHATDGSWYEFDDTVSRQPDETTLSKSFGCDGAGSFFPHLLWLFFV